MALTMNSCATLFNGTKQSVYVRSMTSDSKIYIDGDLEGMDAVTKKLKRNKSHSIIVKKDGYKTGSINIYHDIQVGWLLYGILNNFALIIDAITGSWYELDRTNIVLEIEPLTKSQSNNV